MCVCGFKSDSDSPAFAFIPCRTLSFFLIKHLLVCFWVFVVLDVSVRAQGCYCTSADWCDQWIQTQLWSASILRERDTVITDAEYIYLLGTKNNLLLESNFPVCAAVTLYVMWWSEFILQNQQTICKSALHSTLDWKFSVVHCRNGWGGTQTLIF